MQIDDFRWYSEVRLKASDHSLQVDLMLVDVCQHDHAFVVRLYRGRPTAGRVLAASLLDRRIRSRRDRIGSHRPQEIFREPQQPLTF